MSKEAIEDLLIDLVRPLAETLVIHPPQHVEVYYDELDRLSPSKFNKRLGCLETAFVEIALRCGDKDLDLRIQVCEGVLRFMIKSGSLEIEDRSWSLSDPDSIHDAKKTLHQFMIYWYYNTIKWFEISADHHREMIRSFEERIDGEYGSQGGSENSSL